MALATQNLTTYYAKRIIGDTNATDWSTALLQTGTGVETSTWIFAQTARAGSKCGIRYAFYTDTSNNNIRDVYEIYGGVYDSTTRLYPPIASIECGTGNTYIRGDTHIQGNVNIGTLPNNNNNNNNYRLFVDGSVNFDFTNVNNGEFIVGTSTAYLSINGSTILAYPATTSNNTTVQSTLYLNCTSDTTNPPLGEVYIGGKTTHYGQIYRAYKASGQSAMIRMNGSNYDNYLWKIDSTADGTDSYGYGLKYKGTGSGAANYLQLMADDQGQTPVVAACVDQSGNIGLGTDTTSSSYKLYVTGASYFNGTTTFANDITVNGYLKSTLNGNTIQIGSQDANYAHITNSADIPFIFNKDVLVTNNKNLGSASWPWGNLYIGTANGAGIYYKGSNSTNRMIRFIDNSNDTYGNGISIGGGGQAIIGGGESADTATGQAGTTGGEIMWICNDGAIEFYPNLQSGWTTAQKNYIGTNGHYYSVAVHSAVWNDYAECRMADIIEPGYCITESSNKYMIKTTQRLQPGCKVISDTYGNLMGETPEAKTPVAVAGRVLVYPYKDKTEYKLGDAVCSAPGGTVDVMTREEIMMYPERIVGTVSEIPDYELWHGGRQDGENDIQVKGRIWIYVK